MRFHLRMILFPFPKKMLVSIKSIGVSFLKVLPPFLPLAVPAAVTLLGLWLTETNTMLSREQDIKRDYRSQDDQNAKLVADYYEAMTEFMANKNIFKDDKALGDNIRMLAAMRARTLNVFSQLSYDATEEQSNESGKNTPQSKDSQNCNISDRGSISPLQLLPGMTQEKLRRVEYCTQNEKLKNDNERKGEVLKFLYNANLIGTCPSSLKATEGEKPCTKSIFSLDGAKLIRAKSEQPLELPGVDLSGASLGGAKLQYIDLSRAKLDGANMNNSDLTGAVLGGADLRNARLQEAELSSAYLVKAKLQAAQLIRADLSEANLRDADLSYSNLCGADLRDADLSETNLDGATLELAKYTSKTQWPSGFKPTEKDLFVFNELKSDYSEAQQKKVDEQCQPPNK